MDKLMQRKLSTKQFSKPVLGIILFSGERGQKYYCPVVNYLWKNR